MKCGECTACCTICEIKETNSPRLTPCVNIDENGLGCKIYDKRPMACRKFNCFYSGQPNLPESLRPDMLGAMLEMPRGMNGKYVAHRVKGVDLNVPEFKQLVNKLNAINIEVVLG